MALRPDGAVAAAPQMGRRAVAPVAQGNDATSAKILKVPQSWSIQNCRIRGSGRERQFGNRGGGARHPPRLNEMTATSGHDRVPQLADRLTDDRSDGPDRGAHGAKRPLDEFRKSCDQAGTESQERLGGSMPSSLSSTGASDRFATLPNRPASLRSMQRSRRRGPARPARVSPWWPLRSNNCREIPIPRP